MIKMTRFLVIILVVLFCSCSPLLAANTPSVSEIQRSEELINKDRQLRNRLEESEGKYFIKTITVSGDNFLTEEETSAITASYQKRWLGEGDIRQIIRAIKDAYKQRGEKDIDYKITSQIKNMNLLITVLKLTH